MGLKAITGEVDSQDLNDNYSYLDSQIMNVDGGPGGFFETEDALRKAYPEGSDRFFIINGYSYWWTKNKWTKGSLYQAQGIADNVIDFGKLNSDSISNSFEKDKVNLKFELGTINSKSGALENNNKRIRSNMLYLNDDILIEKISTDIKVTIVKYQKDNNKWLSSDVWNDSKRVYLNAGFGYRIVLAYSDDKIVSDVNALSVSIVFLKKKNDTNNYRKTQFSFKLGTINGTTGNDENSTTRYRTDFFSVRGKVVFNTLRYKWRVFKYSIDKKLIESTLFGVGSHYDFELGYIYKLLLAKNDDSLLNSSLDINQYLINLLEQDLLVTNEFLKPIRYGFYPGIYYSDFTFVKNEMWFFEPSDDLHTDYKKIKRYSVNVEENTNEYLGEIEHNFGHVNTVDYNQKIDTFICGNGSGVYNLNNELYIVENFYNLKDKERVTLDDVALKISLPNSLGKKCNVIWGEDNGSKHNIVYLIMNDTGTIHKVLLGQKEHDLGSGNFNQEEGKRFNGTYKVLKTYNQTTCGYEHVCQGAKFNNGKVYVGIGHEGVWYWELTLNENCAIERKSYRQIIYNYDGTVNQKSMGGVEFYQDHIVLGAGNAYFY